MNSDDAIARTKAPRWFGPDRGDPVDVPGVFADQLELTAELL